MRITPLAFRSTVLLIPALLLCNRLSAQEHIPMLILSGQNNHEWQRTTPFLAKMFGQSGLFTVTVTNRPDTLRYADYQKYRLVVGNWNSWPDTSARWAPTKEQAFTRYINEGGGALFLHAGGSSFYGWQDYHSIAIGRWGKNTSHGSIGDALVHFAEVKHPITDGLKDFTITDEIWENTDISRGATSLGSVQKKKPDGTPEATSYPAILINQYGKGRSFYTILGHDEKVLANPDLQQLLIRAAIWASGTESMFQGKFGTYNFRPDRKPHFHPLISPNGTVLTAESPKDHLWHMGLWFSWKFIDGLNYWEYTGDPAKHISEGMTQVRSIQIDSSQQGDYHFKLNITFHSWDKKENPVMDEVQRITITAPKSDKSYWINYDLTFIALKDLLLDRTPIPGEPGGQSWGGYSGLSLRLNTDFTKIRYFSDTSDSVAYGDRNRWVACEFDNGKGKREQVIIFDNPGNRRHPSPWYCINDTVTPMYFFTPAILYNEPLKLKKGEALHLKYRVYMPARLLRRNEINDL
jgi:type 1 glutamine amidotransferase